MDGLLIRRDLTNEEWREYEYGETIYRITLPKSLVLRENGTTHRVVDHAGITHVLPAPGQQGCALRFFQKPEVEDRVSF